MTQLAMSPEMHDYTVQSLKKALFYDSIGVVSAAREWSDADLDWADPESLSRKRPMYKGGGWHWHNPIRGTIEARLWGGCLEILAMHLSVRRYLPDLTRLAGTVLYVETSEEMPSDGFVYRFFASLAELGVLQQLKAILMAYPKAQFCGEVAPGGRESFIASQQRAVIAALRDYAVTIPVVFNMNFGHTDPQLIVPNGGMVSINGTTKTIQFS